jgi:hypothetical protein
MRPCPKNALVPGFSIPTSELIVFRLVKLAPEIYSNGHCIFLITASVIDRCDDHSVEAITGAADRIAWRHRYICPAQKAARRATSATIAPGANAAATIARFCSSLQDRRRSRRE